MRWILAQICLCLAALAAAAFPAAAEPRPFQLRDGQVVITVILNGREVPALLDTGASKSMIDVVFARELGIRTQGSVGGTTGASGGQVRFGFTQYVKLDIGAGSKRLTIGTYETDHAFTPEGVSLLIGMDLLRKLALSLDFEAMTVDIQPAEALALPAGKAIALNWAGKARPTLSVALGQTSIDLLLDTAASGALHLQTRAVGRSSDLSALTKTRRKIVGIDGEQEQDAIIIPTVRLAGQTFNDVRATMSAMQMHSALDIDGVVGIDLMKRFHIVFDFNQSRVWMTPRVTPPKSSAP